MKKYNILFASHPDYSGNAKAIYEYMKENYKEYNLYCLINDESNYELLKSAGIDCYINGSDEFKKLFDKIDIVFRASIEACEAAIMSSLLNNETLVGRDGHTRLSLLVY